MTRTLAWIVALLAFIAPSVAVAHMGSTKDVQVKRTAHGAIARVDVDAVDVGIALGLGLNVTPNELRTHGPLVAGWLATGLTVVRAVPDATACEATPGVPELVATVPARVAVAIAMRCPGEGPLVLRDETVFVDDPQHRTFVTIATASGSRTAVLRAGAQEVTLEASASRGDTVLAFVEEGAVHLVTGYDHLLFLLSLVLVAGLTLERDGSRAALRDVMWVVTAFTVGHSVSLAAAALRYVELPGRWVEVAIAASIVIVALWNVASPNAPSASTRHARAGIAATFGLVHGLGFSSVLADVGLPATDRMLALVSFNVGIELSQLALVGLALAPLAVAARTRPYRRVGVQGGSLLIAAMGAVWMVERTLG